MSDITVASLDAGNYEVTVREGSTATTHRVAVTAADIERFGGPAERLVEESFRFLLEREPKESILPSFDLAVIGRYFPEYPTDIVCRLS